MTTVGPAPRQLHAETAANETDAIAPAVGLVGVEQAPLLARPYYGEEAPSPITASLAHVPEVLEVALPFIATVLGPSAIDARTKELVIVRTSALLGCRYCVQTHTAIALHSGLSRAEVLSLRGEKPVERTFPDQGERALIDWIDAVALGGPIATERRARAKRFLSDPEIVELTLLAAATAMLNRYCTALELPTSSDTLRRLAELGLA